MAHTPEELLIKSYEHLEERRYTWEPTWEDIGRYMFPERSGIRTKRAPGAKQTEELFDSTGQDSNTKLGSFIASSLTNMSFRFFSLQTPFPELNNNRDVAIWLELVSNIIFAELAVSNFGSESQELYLEAGAFGTGAIYHGEKTGDEVWNGYLFRSEPIGSYCISENEEGYTNGFWRKYEMPLRAIMSKYPDNATDNMKTAFEKNPFQMWELIQCTFPKGEYELPSVWPQLRPWTTVTLETKNKTIIGVTGHDEFPYYVPRWRKTAGEEYGRGPGHIALPDVKTINKADEVALKGWMKALDPPLIVRHDAVIGRVATSPSSLIYTRGDVDGIKALTHEGRWDVHKVLTEDRRARIRAIFFADQLQLPNKTIVTATEVERRIELMQQVLGPVVGRFQYEFLDPMINRAFQQLARVGVLPQPPQILIDTARKAGVRLDVRYEGPLARAQRGGELLAFSRMMASLAAYVQLNPQTQIMDNVDEDMLFKNLSDWSGVGKTYTKPKDLVKAVRVSRQQMQERMAQAQLTQAGSQSVKNVVEADATAKESGADRELEQ